MWHAQIIGKYVFHEPKKKIISLEIHMTENILFWLKWIYLKTVINKLLCIICQICEITVYCMGTWFPGAYWYGLYVEEPFNQDPNTDHGECKIS